MFAGTRRIKPSDGLRSVVIGGNMNLRCEARVQMGQLRTDKLRRRSMIRRSGTRGNRACDLSEQRIEMLPAAPGTEGRDETSRDGDRRRAASGLGVARPAGGMVRPKAPSQRACR